MRREILDPATTWDKAKATLYVLFLAVILVGFVVAYCLTTPGRMV